MIIYNSSKNTLIADDVKVAKNFITRSIGLLSKKNLKTNQIQKKLGIFVLYYKKNGKFYKKKKKFYL